LEAVARFAPPRLAPEAPPDEERFDPPPLRPDARFADPPRADLEDDPIRALPDLEPPDLRPGDFPPDDFPRADLLPPDLLRPDPLPLEPALARETSLLNRLLRSSW